MTPEEQQNLLNEVKRLKEKVEYLLASDRTRINRTIEFTNGAGIGIGSRSVVGFYGKTPTVQFNSTGESVGHNGGGGAALTHSDTFYGGSTFSTGNQYTINDIVKALKTLGLMAP